MSGCELEIREYIAVELKRLFDQELIKLQCAVILEKKLGKDIECLSPN